MNESTGGSGAAAGPASVFAPLPEGLAEMAPGPALGALLAGIDRAGLNGHQLVVLAGARQRQVSFEQAQLLADLHELAHTPPGPCDAAPARQASADPHAADEVSFALCWTTRAAREQLALARHVTAHPPLSRALAQGRIDLPRVKAIVAEVDLMAPGQAAAAIAEVLPTAQYRTTGAIREQIRRLVLTLDPDLVRRRHRDALERRSVTTRIHRDGTASITGRFLPADKAAAAWDYLHRTAAATKQAAAKRTGDAPGTEQKKPGTDQEKPGMDRDQRTIDQIRADVFLDLLAGADPTLPADQGGAGAATPAPRRGVVNLTLELETFLCLNDHPGELAGLGPVIADIARQVAEQNRTLAVWRFQLTHDGRVLHEGRLHRRPTADQAAYVRARDRRCQAPGCRRPAHQSEIDHTIRWEDGGTTAEWNLDTVCKRHHRAKDNAGFGLHRTDFGLLWTTPRGHAYPVTYGRELTQTQRRLLQAAIDNGEQFHPRR